MKNTILSIMAIALLFISCDKNNDLTENENCDFVNFKYYKGEQYFLGELQNNYILLGIDTTYSDDEIRHFISTVSQIDPEYDYTIHKDGAYKFKEIPLRLNSAHTCEQIGQLISDMEQKEIVSYVHYTMQTDNCDNDIWEPMGNLCINTYGSYFLVKVFDENNLTDLNKVIAKTNTELIKQDTFMPEWFILCATKKSKGDALKMANYFHETGLFECAEPADGKYPVE